MIKKYSRMILIGISILLLVAVLAYAFWPRSISVDIGEVVRQPMLDSVTEEGRTRVHDAYVVSTPVAGRLRRVEVDPGDPVERGEDIVAYMAPSNPAVLDVRTREQARANVSAAEAALRLAQAERNRAIADMELAESDLERQQYLRDSGVASEAALDRSIRETRSASAAMDTADAAVSVRQAELANARAMLDGMDGGDAPQLIEDIPIRAPASGRVLRLIQQSETTLPAGAPILEIGNVEHDLEVLVELLSTDAVQVSPGQRVLIEDWGGDHDIEGVVDRVDPWGFTKFSALGVEEQRVNTVIRFTNAEDRPASLGHGYRVVTRIVIWEDENALVVPSSALFRDGEYWAVYVVRSGRAQPVRVDIDRNNGLQAHILSGLEEGDRVVLYPSSSIFDGAAVIARNTVER